MLNFTVYVKFNITLLLSLDELIVNLHSKTIVYKNTYQTVEMKKVLAILIIPLLAVQLAMAGEFSLNTGSVSKKDFYVSVPFEVKNDLLLVNVTVNGKKRKFLLDTGAPTAISTAIQSAACYPFLAELPATDINGHDALFTAVRVDDMQLGNLVVGNIPALVIDKDNPIFRHLGIDGIIGSNMLRDMVVKISLKSGRIEFTDNASLLNTDGAYVSQMFTDRDMQSSPVIRVKLGQGVSEELLFDTGFSGFYDLASNKFELYTNTPDVAVVGKEEGKAMYGLVGKEQPTTKHKVLIPEYNVAGFVYHNVVAYTSSDDNSKLGAKILRTADVTLDYINKKFMMQPYTFANNSFSDFCCMDAYYCKND